MQSDAAKAEAAAKAKSLAESEMQVRLEADHNTGQVTEVTLYATETVGESLERVPPTCWIVM